MITVRNPREATAYTVFAGEALTVGQFVKVAQNSAAGLEPRVLLMTEAEVEDVKILKGVVDFIPYDSLAVDYIIDPTNSSLSLNSGTDGTNSIASGAQCVIWCNRPVIGFDTHSADALLVFASTREADQVAINAATGKVAPRVDAGTDENRDIYVGTVYRNEGPEITVILDGI